jgi:hypothetical protein
LDDAFLRRGSRKALRAIVHPKFQPARVISSV